MRTVTLRQSIVLAVLLVASLTVHAQLASGTILVVDRGAGTGGHGALFAFSGPQLSNVAILTDFGNASQAQSTDARGNKVLGVDPISVSAINTVLGTTILVVDDGAGLNPPAQTMNSTIRFSNRTLSRIEDCALRFMTKLIPRAFFPWKSILIN